MPLIRARARRAVRAVLIALAILAVTPVTACRMSTVTLLIPDFESAAIDGLRFWKLDYAEGVYVEALRLEFTEVVEEDGGETLVYRVWRNGETLSAMVPVVMERIQGYSDAVKVRPMLPSLGPGAYRISSFNAAGDSALSDDWLTL